MNVVGWLLHIIIFKDRKVTTEVGEPYHLLLNKFNRFIDFDPENKTWRKA
jgi:hypothetical protein